MIDRSIPQSNEFFARFFAVASVKMHNEITSRGAQ